MTPAEVLGLLDGVPEGMSVVEDLSAAGFTEITGHDVGLDLHGPPDEFLPSAVERVAHRCAIAFDEVEDGRIGDESALDHLGQAADDFRRRQRGEQIDVADDRERRVERTDEVLAPRRVDARLAAHGRVDHAEDSRRDMDDTDAPQPRRRGEAGHVGCRSPADGDHDIRA